MRYPIELVEGLQIFHDEFCDRDRGNPRREYIRTNSYAATQAVRDPPSTDTSACLLEAREWEYHEYPPGGDPPNTEDKTRWRDPELMAMEYKLRLLEDLVDRPHGDLVWLRNLYWYLPGEDGGYLRAPDYVAK
jgi:hypothetical protein